MTIATVGVQAGASVGISLFPTHSEDPEVLLEQADRAMYHSKRKGENAFSVYTRELALTGD